MRCVVVWPVLFVGALSGAWGGGGGVGGVGIGEKSKGPPPILWDGLGTRAQEWSRAFLKRGGHGKKWSSR